MIWLSWRQFRWSALATFGVLGAIAIALAITGPRVHREGAALFAKCSEEALEGSAFCGETFDDFFLRHLGVYLGITLLVLALPILVGVFWGAPMVSREIETGTQDLVWQQSVTRRRWLAVKVGVVGLVAIAAAGLAGLPLTLWSRPLDDSAFTGITRLTPVLFGARGFAVMGYTAFALALGVAAGLLIRRAVPAMAITFVVFLAAQVLMTTMVRPHFATPERLEAVFTARNLNLVEASGPEGRTVKGLIVVAISPPGSWDLTSETVDSAGRVVDRLPAWVVDCDPPLHESGEAARQECVHRLNAEGYRQAVTYHPAERFWRFQAYETAIYGLLSLLLLGLCFRRMRPT